MRVSRVRKTLVSVAIVLCAAIGSAQAALAIRKAPTRNVSCSSGICTATAAGAVMNAGELTSMLASSDVTLVSGSKAEDIDVKAAFSWASASRLTLDAYRSIVIEKPVIVAGTGALTLITNDGGTGGTLSFALPGRVAFWDLAGNLVINGTTYTLVGNIAALASDIYANPYGHYALADNYDAAADGIYTNSPISTDFGGNLEGLGNTISSVTIVMRTHFSAGFVRSMEGDGVIENLRLRHLDYKVGGSGAVVGGLIGGSSGLLRGDFVSDASIRQNRTADGGMFGGLVGLNFGTISHSAANASLLAFNQSAVGGLVGDNAGMVVDSHAAGTAIGHFNSDAGGLAGINYGGIIEESFATGTATGAGVGGAGGLVGADSGNSGVSNCYATGDATGGSSVGGLIGLQGSNTQVVTSSYSAGSPGNIGDVGGFVGYVASNSSFSDDYWDFDLSGISDPARGAGNIRNEPGITGLSDAQLKSGLPLGFDPSIWAQDPAINGGLPYLIANPPR